MHAFSSAEIHAQVHAARAAELTAEARARHLARGAAPAAQSDGLSAARVRLGRALIEVGTRLARQQPASAL
ncbi:hypothetical protein [Streptomyces bambusae]|uniref:Uncharacterized protein n=1 Tax=Streptomyces bambusae TaxID=1550616 RepID=A0ABS6ZCE7_9ACTN|nr:hypothetical protein [Streptomyces bambusae]MBW5485434.1 hypothetical protein [Streptomyces bambusae]